MPDAALWLLTFVPVVLFPQKLLASGVQFESDPEELDDEVTARVCN